MEKHSPKSKRYLQYFFIILVLGLCILITTSYYIQPLDGDLTRLGGYAERDFGWNMPRIKLNDETNLPKDYRKYYDIVVIGDSFSNSGIWQSLVNDKSNLTFTTLHWDNISIDKLLDHEVYKSSPPKIILAELGVKSFPVRFQYNNQICKNNNVDYGNQALNLDWPLNTGDSRAGFSEYTRNINTNISKIDLKFPLLFLENNITRFLFKKNFSKVKKYFLSRDDLFSNKASDQILILDSWKNWSHSEIENSVCVAKKMQQAILSSNKTQFVILPIPDKGIAYKKYIINRQPESIDNLAQLLEDSRINTVRVDFYLQNAIENGAKDVYLPNDSHFGNIGYQLTAQAVVDYLTNASSSKTARKNN